MRLQCWSHHLSAGGEDEDQGSIAAGEGWCYSTISSWFSISENFTGVTPNGDHVVSFDTEQVEDIDENVELFAAIGTKKKARKWVKKHESQVCDRDKFKMKVVVLHDGSKEVHMPQPVRFAAED